MIRTKRRPHDFYPTTAEWAIDTLLKYWDIWEDSNIFECCYGEGHISKRLEALGYCNLSLGDILDDANYFDATHPDSWELEDNIDFTITNPPFNLAHEILPLAYKHSKYGIAMLLRLSYLEPCENRGTWLVENPVSKLIVMPRISFTANGKTDSVTTAWFVWDKRTKDQELIVVPKKLATESEKTHDIT